MTDRPATVTRLRPRPRHEHALVPAGRYTAAVVDDETHLYFGGAPRLVVYWTIVGPTCMGAVIPAYYVVPRLSGKPRRHGGYAAVRRTSRLGRDLAAMLETRPQRLAGPFPLELVEGRVYSVEIVTVSTDSRQRDLPAGAHYSRLERVLGVDR